MVTADPESMLFRYVTLYPMSLKWSYECNEKYTAVAVEEQQFFCGLEALSAPQMTIRSQLSKYEILMSQHLNN